MSDLAFSSMIETGLSLGVLTPGSVIDSEVHRYQLHKKSRIWSTLSLIEGGLKDYADDPNSGVRVTVMYRLDATNPSNDDQGDFFDMEAYNFQNWGLPVEPGVLDLWIRVRNTGQDDLSSVMGAVRFSFICLPEETGL